MLIVPALFDEANRMRKLTVDVMRRLDAAGIDCFLPDLPGTNESLEPLDQQTPQSWRNAMAAAARHFDASHVLTIRGGALVAPETINGWRYAPAKGATILRQMIRARILAQRENGLEEKQDALMESALSDGIELSGYRLGADFVREFQSLLPVPSDAQQDVGQDMVGGSGLWLRAEPDESREQADALAAIVSVGIRF
ncbi:MAG: hypothetical protein KDE55_22760 [Novosphingobium sp.]|nr:hypothetical protein [Novosphingobium sp.]